MGNFNPVKFLLFQFANVYCTFLTDFDMLLQYHAAFSGLNPILTYLLMSNRRHNNYLWMGTIISNMTSLAINIVYHYTMCSQAKFKIKLFGIGTFRVHIMFGLVWNKSAVFE